MNLNERLSADMKSAMKSKSSLRLNTIRSLRAAITNTLIEKADNNGELSDPEIVIIVRKLAKQRKDSIEQFKQADRKELADKEQEELLILEEYIPESLSASELDSLIKAAIKQTGADSRAQMGAVMGVLKTTTDGRVDGKTLSQAVIAQLT